MNEVSSKICQLCFSTQAESSRFCDNCGNHFVARESSIEDTIFASKSFIGRQVKETRPMFWAGILIVGTLSVFGFAQAGVFSGTFTGAALLGGSQLRPDDDLGKRPEAADPTAPKKENATSDALIDAADNVFDMGHGTESAAPEQRQRLAERPVRSKTKNEQPSAVLTVQTSVEDDLKVAFFEKPTAPVSKSAAEPSVPRNYVRGPMGGCFYLTASGGKRYVDRAMCK